MAHLFRDLSLGHSKREMTPPPIQPPIPPPIMPAKPTAPDLPSPLGQLASTQLTDSDLRLTAYEIFVAVCRTSTAKPLSFVSSSSNNNSSSNNGGSHSDSPSSGPGHHSPNSPGLQRSITSTAASKVKKAFGLKSPKKSPGSGSGSGSGHGKAKRPLTVGELMRTQMGVSEAMDSRVRRALLRIVASQVFLLFDSLI